MSIPGSTHPDSGFKKAADVLYIDPDPNVQFRTCFICDHVRPRAATEHADVARRQTKETVLRPLTRANVLQNVEQLLDRGLARFRIRRMRRAAVSRNDHAHRTLRSGCQATVSRLAVNKETARRGERVLVRRLRPQTPELFINREQ